MFPSEALMRQKLWTTLDALGPQKQQQRQDASQNKIKPFSVNILVFARNYRPEQPKWIPGTIHRKIKRMFVNDVKVGKQL